MPTKKKETAEKLQVKSFKDGSSNFWYENVHYHLNQKNELIWCAGGVDTQERKEAVEAFIKRNKKVFSPREQSILDKEEKVYMRLDFGINKGKNIDECERKYLQWLLNNFNFAAKENLEKEIKQFLGK